MYSRSAVLALAANISLTLAQTVVTVTTSTTYQVIDGFGFSEAFGFGEGVQSAPAAQQTQALNYMFSTTAGAGFTILRNRIAADPGDTIEPTAPATNTSTPTYTWNDDDESQVFWSTQARAMGVKYIYADAWSAPGYMKTNDDYEGGGYLCGVTGETCATGDWRQAYANYLVQYIKDYEAAGITIDFIGFLNEPEFAASYDAMLSDGTQAASFITVLYATLQSAGLSTIPGITCCDAEGWNDQVTYTAQIIAADAEQYVSRITSHWYTSQGTSPISTTLRVWETEYADLNDAFSTVWYASGAEYEGLYWALLIHQGLVECNLSAFLYWVGAQANSNAAGLVTLTGSGSSTVVTPSGILWAFAMFSRYIRPDAVRVATTGTPTNTDVAAFKNADGTIVVVFINSGSTTESASLAGISVSSVAAYYMDNSVTVPTTFATTVSGGSIGAFSLPAYSVVTFVITTGGTVVSSSSSVKTTTSTSKSSTSTVSSTKTTLSTTTTKTSTSASPTSTGTQVEWGQCGGIGWTGPTACVSPYVCTYNNAYYSQCLT